MSSASFPVLLQNDRVATIASGQTESNAINLSGTQLVGLDIPNTFDGTTLTIKSAQTLGGDYRTVASDSGSDFSITVASGGNRVVAISNLAITSPLRFIKLVAGTSQSTTDTVITLITRPV